MDGVFVSFLARFLTSVENQIEPNQEDLKAVAQALIQVGDYGESFKKAFFLADSRGRKAKTNDIQQKSNDFYSMSMGFLAGGAPFWLVSFLSNVNQQKTPELMVLKSVATALKEVSCGNQSFKSAFGLLKKTGQKDELCFTQIPFSDVLQSPLWLIYHEYRRQRKRFNYEQALLNVQDRDHRRRSVRHIERIIKHIEDHHLYIFDIVSHSQRRNWSFFIKNRRNLEKFSLSEAIQVISVEQNITERDVCLEFFKLYQEVAIIKKFVRVYHGRSYYPNRLTKLVKSELQAFSILQNQL